MRAPIILIFTLLFTLPPAASAECSDTACVDVYTEDNQIIIQAHKGNGTSTTKKAPQAKPSPTPTLWFPPKPSPRPYIKRSYKPRTAKPKSATERVNLRDRLTKLVPTAGIAFQPEFQALRNVPVIFWVDVPALFQSRVNIIGESVDVALRPGFIWSYGDGSTWATTETGAPYPNQKITHTYSAPGTYVVTLLTTWNGSFTHNGAVRAITGEIVNASVATVTVVSAPTRFTK
ncbi:MAG: PKD domain-containing protein [Actinomycetota bacterium]|nr:PKD domain-containing protein [Actinomycetota bacterium]